MLPYLEEGRAVRTILDRHFPGMAPKIQSVGRDLMKEQESGRQQHGSTAAQSSDITAGNRFPPLKQRMR